MKKKVSKKFKLSVKLFFTFIAIVNFVINFINGITFKMILIHLNENQILYFYSSMAQIVGSLMGIIIAGYSLIDSKRNKNEFEGNTVEDDISKEQFLALVWIIFICLLTIILCFIVLVTYDKGNFIVSFAMIQVVINFIFLMIGLIKFIVYLNPDVSNKINSKNKAVIDKNNGIEKFTEFVTQYNLFQNSIENLANNLNNNQKNINKYRNNSNRSKLVDSIYCLYCNEIILNRGVAILNNIRQYRNMLIHGIDEDKTVNKDIFEQVKKIQEFISILNALYLEKNDVRNTDFKSKKEELNNYIESIDLNEFENSILNYIRKYPNCNINKLVNEFKCSYSFMHNKLNYLKQLGKIEYVKKGNTYTYMCI